MRKGVSILLLFAMLFALFAACAKKEETAPQGGVGDMSGEQNFNIGGILSNSTNSSPSGTVSSEPSQGGTSETSTDGTHNWSGEFIITEKKYAYKEKNFMLLNVTNDTGINCDLTITGTFYDEAGDVVRIQQQTYRNHPTGWSNYFIFYLNMKFDTFTYEVSAEEFENDTLVESMFVHDGEELSDCVTIGWILGVYWDSDPYGTPMLMYRMTESSTHPECEVKIFGHALILDGNGDVYALDIADTLQDDMISKFTQTGAWPHMEEDPLYADIFQALRWVSKDSPEYAEPLPKVLRSFLRYKPWFATKGLKN